MNFFNEYALLVAVAVPVLALVGLNVFLWMGGERGTLLMPTKWERVPSAIAPAEAAPAAVTDTTPASIGDVAEAPANDAEVRKAA